MPGKQTNYATDKPRDDFVNAKSHAREKPLLCLEKKAKILVYTEEWSKQNAEKAEEYIPNIRKFYPTFLPNKYLPKSVPVECPWYRVIESVL